MNVYLIHWRPGLPKAPSGLKAVGPFSEAAPLLISTKGEKQRSPQEAMNLSGGNTRTCPPITLFFQTTYFGS